MNYRQVIASLNGDQLEVECLCEGISHVGIVAVVFAMMGAVYILRFERNQTVWIALTVLSFSLSLGLSFVLTGRHWTSIGRPIACCKTISSFARSGLPSG